MASENSFSVFNYMDKSCSSWSNAMDVMPSSSMSDSQSTDVCCRQCQCVCWPCIFIFDILSCPFRFCVYKSRSRT